MHRKKLCLRIVILTILSSLFCGCQCYNRQDVCDVPESTFGIIMVHRNSTSDELKMYAETAIELYNKGRISGLVIVAKDDEAHTIYSFLAESNLKDYVVLNAQPGRPMKVLSIIGDVLGYRNSYTIVSRHRLYRLEEIYF